MKKAFLPLILLLVTLHTIAQDKTDSLTAHIVEEGKQLYRSEMASWYGADVFLEQFKDKTKIGGYFSYLDGNDAKCVFYGKGAAPKVIGTITFDETYNVSTANTDLAERDFTPTEKGLYTIRTIAFKIINNDTLFKVYENTSLNLIPFIFKGQKKVYVLTGPEKSGVVIFGNDYLLTFNAKNLLTGKKQLHRNIIMTEYGKQKDQTEVGSMHTHLPETGNFMTPTDICTLMLYEKFTKWQQYIVMSAHYINIWDCNKNELLAITREAWDKIQKDQEQRNKKN